MRVIITLLTACMMANATYVVVTDTIRDGSGTVIPAGTITITPNSQFACSNGDQIYPVSKQVPIIRGVFTTTLCSNTDATPTNTSYTAKIVPLGLTGNANSTGGTTSETWVVTTLTPSHLPDVRTSPTPIPSFLVNLSQLRPLGMNGQCIVSNAPLQPGWGSCNGSAAFSSITSGTNTVATMVVGSGASLSFTGSGFINANRLLGVSLTTLTGVGLWTSGVPSVVAGTSTNCIHVDGTSAACASGGATIQNLGTVTTTTNLDGASGTTKTITMTLGASISCGTLTNFTPGQITTVKFTQDGTGSRVFTCAGMSNLGDFTTVPYPASKTSIQSFYAITSSTLQALAPMWCLDCDPAIILPNVSSGAATITSDGTGAQHVPAINGSVAVISGTPANNDCSKFVVSGSVYNITTAGSTCGGASVPDAFAPNQGSDCWWGCDFTNVDSVPLVANDMTCFEGSPRSTETAGNIVLEGSSDGGTTKIAGFWYSADGNTLLAQTIAGGMGGGGTTIFAFASPYQFKISTTYVFCYSVSISSTTEFFNTSDNHSFRNASTNLTPSRNFIATNPSAWSGTTPNPPATLGARFSGGCTINARGCSADHGTPEMMMLP